MKIEIENKTKSKKEKRKKTKRQAGRNVSELRQDMVTGDWVVIATKRAKRPEDFAQSIRESITDENDVENCFFCEPEKTGQEKDVLIYRTSDKDWTLRVFPNKYPAFSRGKVPQPLEEGPYFAMTGTGYHELIVTRDHYKQIALLDKLEVAEVFDAFQDRYLALMNRKSVNYISIFHNHGREAGASIAHPHSQLMAIPVISPYIKLELDGSENYYRSNKECVFCVMSEYESESQKRKVYENDDFIAFCPFASRAAFEVWVMPRKHNPYFERISSDEKIKLAEVFQKALHSIYKALGDPPYNFYIHTAPCDGKDYSHFHWHIEILPHTATWAGFELETGIEISVIQPEAAAEFLRKQIE